MSSVKSSIKNIILGIDPGITGAFCAYDFLEKKIVFCRDMPTQKSPVDGKNHINAKELGLWIDSVAHQTLFAVVEEPNSLPNQGVVSTFRFGYACGMVAGTLGALQIDTLFFKPSVWKMQMALSESKELSRQRAIALFPQNLKLFENRKDDGKAEALLLSVFGERFVNAKKV